MPARRYSAYSGAGGFGTAHRPFCFEGFLPQKKGRQKRLQRALKKPNPGFLRISLSVGEKHSGNLPIFSVKNAKPVFAANYPNFSKR
jgi:hypothetical protein